MAGKVHPVDSGVVREPRVHYGNLRRLYMHSFLVATTFIAMVLAPCIVAMFTGLDNREETL
jgi:hypothetical protein